MIDIFIIIIYFLAILGYGFYKGRGVKDIKDYSVGNRKFSIFAITATVAATIIGGGTTLSNASIFYTVGILCFAGEACECIQLLITAKYIIPRMHLFEGAISIGDMMGRVFGKQGRVLTGISSVILSTGTLGAQVSALGFIFNQFIGIDHSTGALIGFSILTLYSIFGGIRSVAATDLLQFIVLIIAIPIVGSYAVHACGGYDAIIEQLPSSHFSFFPNLEDSLKYWPYFLAFMIPEFTPTVTQRMLLSGDAKKLKNSFIISGFLKIFFTFSIMSIGFSAYILFPGIEPHNAVPSLIDHVLPVGIKGLAIAGLLAIVMSTADSLLNTASISLIHDVIAPLKKNGHIKNELTVTRIATFVISTAAIFIALYHKSIFEIVRSSYKYWTPLVSIPLIFKIMGRTPTKSTFYISTCITTLFLSLYFLIEDIVGIASYLPAILLSALIYFLLGGHKKDFKQVA